VLLSGRRPRCGPGLGPHGGGDCPRLAMARRSIPPRRPAARLRTMARLRAGFARKGGV